MVVNILSVDGFFELLTREQRAAEIAALTDSAPTSITKRIWERRLSARPGRRWTDREAA